MLQRSCEGLQDTFTRHPPAVASLPPLKRAEHNQSPDSLWLCEDNASSQAAQPKTASWQARHAIANTIDYALGEKRLIARPEFGGRNLLYLASLDTTGIMLTRNLLALATGPPIDIPAEKQKPSNGYWSLVQKGAITVTIEEV